MILLLLLAWSSQSYLTFETNSRNWKNRLVEGEGGGGTTKRTVDMSMESTDREYCQVLVDLSADEINVNNVKGAESSIYLVLDQKGLPFVRPSQVNKATPQCELCFTEFLSYSKLFSHQAHPCLEDSAISFHGSEPMTVSFAEEELTYIADALDCLGLPVTTSNGQCSVVVDKTILEIFMRQLYQSRITKYNLEEWYFSLQELADRLQAPKGKTIWVHENEHC
jgi:hypothetical protein